MPTINRTTNSRRITGTGATAIQITIKAGVSLDERADCHTACPEPIGAVGHCFLRDAKCLKEGKSVKRPIGVTIIAVLTFFAATVLALGSIAFFLVAVLGITGGDAGDPVSTAIAGMGVAGGFSLLVLASVGGCLAIGVPELQESARIVSIASIAAALGCTILSLSAFRRYAVIPVVPSIVFHLLVMTTADWMLAYLLRLRVKQAFSLMIA